MIHVLEMLNPAVNPGLTMTVRSGAKWLKAEPGDTLAITRTGASEALYRATVIASVRLDPDQEIPENLLRFCYQPANRTREGLNQSMVDAYGPGWSEFSKVLLFFYV